MTLLLVVGSAAGATLPLLFFLGLMWWFDRYEREPWWLVGLVFGWGALGGVALAIVASTLAVSVAAVVLPDPWLGPFTTVVIAPLVEEPVKALVLALVVWSRHFDNTTDGFVYGAAAGLGFGMTENLLYFLEVGGTGDARTWAGTVIVRTFYSALMHASASSMVGATLGWARFHPRQQALTAVPAGLAAAVAVHALWNGLLVADDLLGAGGVLAGVDLMLFPLEFLVLFVVYQICVWDEGRVIRAELRQEADRGTLPEAHVARLASWLGRHRLGWVPAGVDQRAYVRLATELAFRRVQARSGWREPHHAREVGRLRVEVARLAWGAGRSPR